MALRKKTEINQLFLTKPIFRVSRQDTFNSITTVNHENWVVLEILLYEYQLMVRGFLETHKLTSPEGDDPSFAAHG